MENVGLKVELVNAKLANWLVLKNDYLCAVACVTEWFLQVVQETEKAVKVKIFDERKHQTAETSRWEMWIPKSAIGCLNK